MRKMAMANIRNKTVKIITVVLSGLILIALVGFVFLYLTAQSYLNKNLSDFIEKKSKGKYVLTFENLDINFTHWGFEVNQVSFHPSDSILKTLDQTDINKQFYTFSSPNIRFGGIQLIKLIFDKKLEIGEIHIYQPELNIHGTKSVPDNQKNNISSILQELRPLVTKTFKSIQIDKIELANASFDFYNLLGDSKKLSNAENITIGILNFYTDSVLLPDLDRLFDAEDIYIRMQNYQNKLADSIHSLSAESVTYSMKRAQIEAQNIELKPVNGNNSVKSRYHITVPHAKITSSQINEFYQNKAIPIDSLILTDAIIKYWPGQQRTKARIETIDDFDLYELIKDELSSVSIQVFKLDNTQVMLFKMLNDTTRQQELKKISINLEDFLLDSVSRRDTSRIFYAKDINFSASDYELTLGDNIHRVKIGNLNLSTLGKSVLVKNIQLYPLPGSNTISQKNTIEASCDSIRLDLFRFKKAFHEKRFVFQRINIFNPDIKIIRNELSKEKSESEDPNFVYNLISSYVKGIYSNQVFIKKGKIQLVNKTGVLQRGNIESTIKLQLNGFALDEISTRRTDRLFFADQIDLNFSNYQMQLVDQLHKLTIENLAISTRKKQLNLKNLHLYPVSKENMEDILKQYGRSELYEFTIPELSLSNADFHEAFFNKNLSVDTLSIKTPQIYFENFSQLKLEKPKADFEDLFELLSSYLDNIQIVKVEIPDGTIRLINHSKNDKTISLNNHFSLELENTRVNKEQFGQNKLLFSEFIDFTVRDHLIRLSDNVHVIKASEVGFSTRRKEIFVINARIYPEPGSKDFSSTMWNIQLTVPEIRIKGIDIEEFYFDRKINADNLLINSPNIKLYQKKKRTTVAKDIKEVTFPLPKEIESIAIRQFKLNSGSLKVFSEIGIKPYLLVQSDLNMAAQNILIKKNLKADRPEFVTGEYTGEMLQFKFTPKDKNQQFSIDELTFSTKDQNILAKQLVLKPVTKSTKENQFELRIPMLSMNGFDLDKAYLNDQFFFESIIVEKPSFQLFNNAKDSFKINPFKLNLYPHFESFADVFVSKSIRVKDAEIAISKIGKKKLQEKVTFNLLDVRIDDKPSRGFMHANNFSFSIPSLKIQENLYTFSIGAISYSSLRNRFSASDIRVVPNLSKVKHQKQVGFQSDYLKGKIDSIGILQPDIRRWFEKEELVGKLLSINGLNMDIYRDKRLPFDESRRPDMIQDLIKSSKYPFLLDSFKLVNAYITYTEQPESGNPEGTINFTNIQARLKPFSNMKSATGKIPDISMDGTATIMDSCQLKININFQMNHPENLFTVTGSLSPFNMRILNPVLEPLASVSMRSGQVDHFDFNFSSDKTSSSGQLFFGYDDLRISILETKNGNVKEAWFTSFIANSFFLSSKNPRGKELLPEEINFKRDEKRSVLSYLWKSIFEGIRNTLGIKEKKQEEQVNQGLKD